MVDDYSQVNGVPMKTHFCDVPIRQLTAALSAAVDWMRSILREGCASVVFKPCTSVFNWFTIETSCVIVDKIVEFHPHLAVEEQTHGWEELETDADTRVRFGISCSAHP